MFCDYCRVHGKMCLCCVWSANTQNKHRIFIYYLSKLVCPLSRSWRLLLRLITTMFIYSKRKHFLGLTWKQIQISSIFEGPSCASEEKTSVMAREAVCSSTHQANGIRPLYANERSALRLAAWAALCQSSRRGSRSKERRGRRRRRLAHLSACHSRTVFSGLRGARAKTRRLQPRDQGAYEVKPVESGNIILE